MVYTQRTQHMLVYTQRTEIYFFYYNSDQKAKPYAHKLINNLTYNARMAHTRVYVLLLCDAFSNIMNTAVVHCITHSGVEWRGEEVLASQKVPLCTNKVCNIPLYHTHTHRTTKGKIKSNIYLYIYYEVFVISTCVCVCECVCIL